MKDEDYLTRTFELARRGLGTTFPNPLVGAVIVKNGRIIAEGFHRAPGEDHAEIDALKNCKEPAEGATIYVNLEPCCHTGKLTPPCAPRLIAEKLKRVVISNLDPNPAVNGKGVELLRQNGIDVEVGLKELEGEHLNEVFFFAQRNRRPFVHLKVATTLDGKMALPSGESQWITGEAARAHVHLLRSQHQGIMVGAETLRKDNPKLNVRLPGYQGKQPYRIIFTRSGVLPAGAEAFHDDLKEQTLVLTMAEGQFALPKENIIRINSLAEAMERLFEKKLINLFLEGGPALATAFLKEQLINRVSLYINPSFLGSGKEALLDFGVDQLKNRPRLQNIESSWIEGDLFLTGTIT